MDTERRRERSRAGQRITRAQSAALDVVRYGARDAEKSGDALSLVAVALGLFEIDRERPGAQNVPPRPNPYVPPPMSGIGRIPGFSTRLALDLPLGAVRMSTMPPTSSTPPTTPNAIAPA